MRLTREFYHRDCLKVAPELVGKILVRTLEDGSQLRLRISETEAYRGEEDTACHAHKGRTKRTEVLYREPGRIYVYLCYGVHWLLNIVTGEEDAPQAVLIRACVGADGPGKLTKGLKIDKTFNDTSILTQKRLWVEDDGMQYAVLTDTRVGIGYASEEDQARLWRFKLGAEKAGIRSEKDQTKSAGVRSRLRRIGVTGGVGAGKSRILDWLEKERGARIIRTDDVAKELMEPGGEGYEQVIAALGGGFIREDGTIDRPALAKIIFQDEKAREKVDQIIHPLVWKRLEQMLADIQAAVQEESRREAQEESQGEVRGDTWAGDGAVSLVVVESALFDKTAMRSLDEMWYVYVPEETRIRRLMESRGYSLERCQSMLESQPEDEAFCGMASYIIDNGGAWEDTVRQLKWVSGLSATDP